MLNKSRTNSVFRIVSKSVIDYDKDTYRLYGHPHKILQMEKLHDDTYLIETLDIKYINQELSKELTN